MSLTYDELVSVLGPVEETLAAEIMATGASLSELTEAWAWLNNDEALINQGRPRSQDRRRDRPVDRLRPRRAVAARLVPAYALSP
jgi:hypothetical protein